MKLAIVVGHRKSAQGATAVDGVQEWSWNRPLADQIAAGATALGHDVRVFYRPDRSGYSKAMGELVSEVNAYAPDLVLSLHFDSSTDTSFRGASALHWPGSKAGRMWAVQLSAAVARAAGIRSRGAIAQVESWAGSPLYILRDTVAPAVIIESHFGSNAADHVKATAARDSGDLARAIVGVLP